VPEIDPQATSLRQTDTKFVESRIWGVVNLFDLEKHERNRVQKPGEEIRQTTSR
jgi:hypothetical protein